MRCDVEQGLDWEARRDKRRVHACLDHCTDNVRYLLPVRRNRSPKESNTMVLLDPNL